MMIPDFSRKRRRLLAGAVSVVGASALMSGCAALQGGVPGESVDAYAVRAAGSELVYRTFNGYNRELRSIATRRFTDMSSTLEGLDYQEAGSGGFGDPVSALVAQEYNAEGDLLAWQRADGGRTRFDPPLHVLPFPLVPGHRTRQDVYARDTRGGADSRPRRVIMITRVGGWESVSVPAGQFRALRVTRNLYLGDFEFHRTETQRLEIDWYAPDVGAVVRSSEDSVHEDLLMGRDLNSPSNTRRGDWLVRELVEVLGLPGCPAGDCGAPRTAGRAPA